MDVYNGFSMRAVCYKRRLCVFGTLLFIVNGSFGGISFHMEDYCYSELSFILESVYQAKLQLTDNNLIDKANPSYPYEDLGYCEVALEAWYTYFSQLMFYFEDLDLDCDKGYLEFYSGEKSDRRVEGLTYDVCGKVKPEGVFIVDSRYFRIRYVPHSRQYYSNVFSLIITSFGDETCPSYGHECGNSRCIHDDVACNGYDSCGDDTGCDIESSKVVGIFIGSIVGVGLIISIVVCCICCRRRSRGAPGTVQGTATTTQAVTYAGLQTTSQPTYGMSQGSPYTTNMMSNPVSAPTNAAIPGLNQQSYVHHSYNFNQGTNYQSNQAPYVSHPQTSGQRVDPSAPPPSYDEIFANSCKT